MTSAQDGPPKTLNNDGTVPRRMRIGVDFDDVLYPYHHYLKRRIAKHLGVDLTKRRITTFYYDLLPEIQRLGITREQIWDQVQATWLEAPDHDEAPLLDAEAAPILRSLGRSHEVVVVTARSHNARSFVQRFLARHGIAPRKILLGREEKNGFDVLVDDFPRHALENAEAGGHSILYTIDENSTFDESRHPRIVRVHSWGEVRDAVQRIGIQRRLDA